MKISKAALAALQTLADAGAGPFDRFGMTGGAFARKRWADAWAATRSTYKRHGLRRRGGSYLAWLMERGLVARAEGNQYQVGYKLSQRGLAVLRNGGSPCPHPDTNEE